MFGLSRRRIVGRSLVALAACTATALLAACGDPETPAELPRTSSAAAVGAVVTAVTAANAAGDTRPAGELRIAVPSGRRSGTVAACPSLCPAMPSSPI
jgi:uncharacterized lipoprotein YajG